MTIDRATLLSLDEKVEAVFRDIDWLIKERIEQVTGEWTDDDHSSSNSTLHSAREDLRRSLHALFG